MGTRKKAQLKWIEGAIKNGINLNKEQPGNAGH